MNGIVIFLAFALITFLYLCIYINLKDILRCGGIKQFLKNVYLNSGDFQHYNEKEKERWQSMRFFRRMMLPHLAFLFVLVVLSFIFLWE